MSCLVSYYVTLSGPILTGLVVSSGSYSDILPRSARRPCRSIYLVSPHQA